MGDKKETKVNTRLHRSSSRRILGQHYAFSVHTELTVEVTPIDYSRSLLKRPCFRSILFCSPIVHSWPFVFRIRPNFLFGSKYSTSQSFSYFRLSIFSLKWYTFTIRICFMSQCITIHKSLLLLYIRILSYYFDVCLNVKR